MQPFTILLVFFTSSVTITQGAVGPPILYSSSQTGPALFSWSLSDVDTSLAIVVTSPAEKEVFFFNGNGTRRYSISSRYKDRVVITLLTYKFIQFSLSDVTVTDAGNYTCRKGDEKIGPYIPNCGQILYYLDENSEALKPYARISREIREGQALNLTCVREVNSLPLSPLSWNWTFQASASTPPPRQLNETGDTLTLDHLTKENSGLYSCHTSSVAGQSSLNLNVTDKSSTTLKPNESTFKPNREETSRVGNGSNETSFRTATIVLGVMLGVAVIVIVILALVFCAWRKKKLCFARRRDDENADNWEMNALRHAASSSGAEADKEVPESVPMVEMESAPDADPSDEAETSA